MLHLGDDLVGIKPKASVLNFTFSVIQLVVSKLHDNENENKADDSEQANNAELRICTYK